MTTLSAQYPLALWNERDPILKERAFGLTNSEGNHGEDVKDCYFDLDRWLKEHKAHPLVSRLEGSVGLRIGEPFPDLDDCLGALGPLEWFRKVAIVNCDVAV